MGTRTGMSSGFVVFVFVSWHWQYCHLQPLSASSNSRAVMTFIVVCSPRSADYAESLARLKQKNTCGEGQVGVSCLLPQGQEHCGSYKKPGKGKLIPLAIFSRLGRSLVCRSIVGTTF